MITAGCLKNRSSALSVDAGVKSFETTTTAMKATRMQAIHSSSRRGTTRCKRSRGIATNHAAKKNGKARASIQRNENQPNDIRIAEVTNRFWLGVFMACGASERRRLGDSR